MDIKWFEDFLSVCNTHSFSRSAEERHVTQSTLSRRIQSLEQWIEVPLIDRSNYPLTLTPAGEQFQRDCWQIVRRIYQASAEARARNGSSDAPVRFGMQHTLASYCFLPWLRRLEAKVDVGSVQVKSDNLSNSYDDLINNRIDFMVCYQHSGLAGVGANHDLPGVRIDREKALPVTAPNSDGTPMYYLPGTSEQPLPYIGYGPDVPIGWNREKLLSGSVSDRLYLNLKHTHEASMGEIIKAMVIEGRGMAFLPEALVAAELRSGALTLAGDKKWAEETEIWAYRSIIPRSLRIESVWDAIRQLGRQ